VAFVSDSFTDTDTTELSLHTGETGATWTKHASYSTLITIVGNRAVVPATTNTLYYASGTPTNADYDVEAAITPKAVEANVGICARIDTSANTLYILQYVAASTRWEIGRFSAGSYQALGTFTQTLTVDQAYAVKFELRGDALKAYIDSVERISVTDSTITAAGRVGIRGSRVGADAATRGLHVDDFSASDPAVAGQFARPDADVSAGTWTTAPLWSSIDEAAADDGDLITSSTTSGSTCEVALSDVTDPAVSTGHIVRYRYSKTATGGSSPNITVDLVENTTVRASSGAVAIPDATTWNDGTFTLTGGEADSITDYADLRLRFTMTRAGGSARGARVSWAEFEVPAAGTPASLTVAAATAPAAGGTVNLLVAAILSVTAATSAAAADGALTVPNALTVTAAEATAAGDANITAASILTVTPAESPAAGGSVNLSAASLLTITPAESPAAADGALTGQGALGVVNATAPAQAESVDLVGSAVASLMVDPATSAAAGGPVNFTAAARMVISEGFELGEDLLGTGTLGTGLPSASADGGAVTFAITSALIVTPAEAPASGGTVNLTAASSFAITPAEASAVGDGALTGQGVLGVSIATAPAAGGAVDLLGDVSAAGTLTVAAAEAPAAVDANLTAASVFAANTATATAQAETSALIGQARLAVVAAEAAAQAETVSLTGQGILSVTGAESPAQGEGVTFDAAARMVLAEALASAEAGAVSLNAGGAASLTVSPATADAAADSAFTAAATFGVTTATAVAEGAAVSFDAASRMVLVSALAAAAGGGVTLAAPGALAVDPGAATAAADGAMVGAAILSLDAAIAVAAAAGDVNSAGSIAFLGRLTISATGGLVTVTNTDGDLTITQSGGVLAITGGQYDD